MTGRKAFIYIFIAMALSAASSFSADGQERDNSNWPTYISPYYFGPNAFPVPDIPTVSSGKLEADIYGDNIYGSISDNIDKTSTLGFAVKVPLWSDRVNFSLWGQFCEWYKDNPEARSMRKAEDYNKLQGTQFGDIYFSVDATVLKESKTTPGVIVRAACKTATGGGKQQHRFYDAPGYFIDASAYKHFRIDSRQSVNATALLGFICWQTRVDRQNDAFMYGISAGYDYDGIIKLNASVSGYYGWRHDGDSPIVFKFRAYLIPDKRVSPFIEYNHGFRDWPFDCYRIGARGSFDIFGFGNK